ncbi:hypothetical protein F8A87_02630 [Betaproteobacteria bacterium SCN2]|nr:hypothetical protein F8A87_02630 [Betaproteobacteria bacterium SCN2]
MKLHLNSPDGRYQVTGYGDDHVLVNDQRLDFGLVLSPSLLEQEVFRGLVFEALEIGHFEWLRDQGAEIVLLGTGAKLRFPHPSLTRPLMQAGIGLEVMDTGAACRTYNLLASEGRKVLVAILA